MQTGIPGLDPYGDGGPIVYAGWEATFDATGSSGDGLLFAIDLGDGTVAKTAVVRRVISLDPHDALYRRVVRASVTDRFGRVDSETVSLRLTTILTNASDEFLSLNVEDPFHSRYLFFQHQNGTQLTGNYQDEGRRTTPLTATLSGANHIHIRLDDGTIDMDGIFTYQGPTPNSKFPDWLILSVRGGSAHGRVVPFVYYDPY